MFSTSSFYSFYIYTYISFCLCLVIMHWLVLCQECLEMSLFLWIFSYLLMSSLCRDEASFPPSIDPESFIFTLLFVIRSLRTSMMYLNIWQLDLKSECRIDPNDDNGFLFFFQSCYITKFIFLCKCLALECTRILVRIVYEYIVTWKVSLSSLCMR